MDALKKRRGYVKGIITKIENWVNSNLAEENDKNQIEVRKKKLLSSYQNYEKIQEQIAELDETGINDSEDIDEKYYNIVAAIERKINELTKNETAEKTAYHELIDKLQQANKDLVSDLVNGISSNLSINQSGSKTVNLPEIKIPIFSGDAANWNSFYDLFDKLIIQKSDLDDVQKLIYLKGYLRGEALSLIQNLALVGPSFQTALKILTDRYKDTYTIIEAHIANLVENLPTLIKPKAQNLRDFLTKINQNIESLKNLNVPIEHWDLMLLHVFSKKLDFSLHKTYCLQRDTKQLPTLKEFLTFLEKQCRALEEIETKHSVVNTNNKVSHFNSSISSSGSNSPQASGSQINSNCIYCSGQHSIYRCSSFKELNVNARIEFITNQGLCKNCLIYKHAMSMCTARKCLQCGKNHNTLLHIYYNSQRNEENSKENWRSKETKQVQDGKNRNSWQSNQSENRIQKNEPSCNENRNKNNENVNDRSNDSAHSSKEYHNSASNTKKKAENSLSVSTCSTENVHILLATAVVTIFDSCGNPVKARCLLDSASQSSMCTRELLNKLNLQTYQKSLQISGISQEKMLTNEMVDFKIVSNANVKKDFHISCVVLDKITCKLPQMNLNISKFKLPENIFLADPQFYISSKIDILLGADIYYDLIVPGIIKLGENMPSIFNTHLGHIVGGKTSNDKISSYITVSEPTEIENCVSLLSCKIASIDEIIKKFWILEEVENKTILSADDEKSEQIFKESTIRLGNGQFQVDLPFKNSEEHLKLGDSFTQAKKRFISLENKLTKNVELKQQYKEFINEYIQLNHAKTVPLTLQNEIGENKYFMPHHAVIREDSETTRLRVVFDASMKTTTGISLNNILLKGYTVQPELFDILNRFRLYQFVAIVDIQKMYRQIQVNPKHTFLQNILWRENPGEELKCLELLTVTYGTNFAPFVATRCLNELAYKEKQNYPLAADVLLNQTYVDDALIGANSICELTMTCTQLTNLLNSAGFHLHKWHSNSKQFVNTFFGKDSNETYDFQSENKSNKVLGLQWNSIKDVFTVSLPEIHEKKCFTKREVLSKIASMFDPLGVLGPVIVVGKIIMQEIWILKLDWDDYLPEELNTRWNNYFKKLSALTNVKIPRHLCLNYSVEKFEIHSFSDASLRSYGACLYLRILYSNKMVSCRLICSKSRVSPLKTISLARLELCGAELAGKLLNKCLNIFENKVKFSSINLWTDSEIVLYWLSSHASRWSIFVANRVSTIQTLTSDYIWRHVKSENNPADILSRGISPDKIKECDMWWQGPKFLQNYDLDLNTLNFHPRAHTGNLDEERKNSKTVSLHAHIDTFWTPLVMRFSCFSRFQRTIAYCLRFLNDQLKLTPEKTTGPLTVQELKSALTIIIKKIQLLNFALHIEALKSQKPITDKHILRLNPFLDNEGVLRVGGRLANANIPYEQRFPIILPSKNHVTDLLLRKEHLRLGHAGPQTVLSNIRLRYWPLNGLKEIKKIINKCTVCYRFKAQPANQIMSNLPKDRVTASRPFYATGVDFGGPLLIKSSPIKNAKLLKCYFAVFVCMATKAVHIELVSELTTDAFIATLKRFIARRGNPKVIYSDNATNFLGSKNEIKKVYDFFKIPKNLTEVQEFLSEKEIQWKYIPPLSPHWGGIWEAAIKSTKYHLHRVVADAHLTFEKLYTCLTQIESILNSRPLCAMSTDPSDMNILTPGHFLIGSSLTAFPEKDVSNIQTNRLSKWQQISKIRQHFWKRWSVDYLNQLQNRPKWLRSSENLKINDLVLLKEDNVPPLKWPRARIVEVVPGSDGKVRMVKLKTQKGEFVRNISKVCPLPRQELVQ